MINLFQVVNKLIGRSGKPKAPKAEKPRKAKAAARGAARAALQALAPRPASKTATYQGKPATGQFVDAPQRRKDPWYSADAHRGERGSSWIPDRPGWFQPGNGRPGVTSVATIVGPDGDARYFPAPDYAPRRLEPPER
jgi:hypothetical protein